LVNGCTALAKNSNISNLTIGLTIVAFGTSTPEISINLFAAFDHDSFITMGNVLGSNIFNVALILGIIFFLTPLFIQSKILKLETIYAFLASIVLLVIAKDKFFTNASINSISRSEGVLMLIFFFVFVLILLNSLKNGQSESKEKVEISKPKSITYIVLGIGLLIAGGQLIVFSVKNFVEYFSVTERIVALIIISAGTSLPELAMAIMAGRKGNAELVMGTIIGSNIFNVFFVLGLSSVIREVHIWRSINLDIFIHILVCLLLFVFIVSKNRLFVKINSGLLIIVYLSYVYYLLFIM